MTIWEAVPAALQTWCPEFKPQNSAGLATVETVDHVLKALKP